MVRAVDNPTLPTIAAAEAVAGAAGHAMAGRQEDHSNRCNSKQVATRHPCPKADAEDASAGRKAAVEDPAARNAQDSRY